MLVVKQSNDRSAPASWKGVVRDGKRTAGMTCPNGHIASLCDHTIAADGKVSPSVVCPCKECTFHEYVQLEGWEAKSVAPQPQSDDKAVQLLTKAKLALRHASHYIDAPYKLEVRQLADDIETAIPNLQDDAVECPQEKCVYRGARAFCSRCLRLAGRPDHFMLREKGEKR